MAHTHIAYISKYRDEDDAPVVQRADNFIRWINRYPADKMYFKEYVLDTFIYSEQLVKERRFDVGLTVSSIIIFLARDTFSSIVVQK